MSSINTNPEAIKNVLTRSVVDVIVKKDLEAKLKSGKQLRVKLGIDPSSKDLHIGHMVVIKKLREFQEMGHQVILLFGNFTAQIGDPTGKGEARKMKTQTEVEENAKTYVDQVKRFLDIDKVEVRWNADWLGKMSFNDVIQLASNFTVAQMLERDMFQERMKNAQPISVHEFMYPLMQGYDSVALKADLELGATEQTFNLLAGRVLQKEYGQVPQNILTTPILVGLDGKKKMGKSEGNFIAIQDPAEQMFGKIMSIPDEAIIQYYELCTNLTMKEIEEVKKSLVGGENPRDIKMDLAEKIATIYHNEASAAQAKAEFIQIFSKKGLPEDIETIRIDKSNENIITLLADHKLVPSRGEAKRLILGGGIKINQVKVENAELIVDFSSEQIIQVGKRKFIKFIKE